MKNNGNEKDKAYDIRKIYEEMELELIRSMKRNLKRHEEEEVKVGFIFEQWQSAKLRDLERFRKENQEIIGKYSEPIEELLTFTLVETYKKTQDNVNEFIKEIKNKYVDDVFVRLPGDLEPLTPSMESTEMKDMVEQVLENIETWQDAPTPRDEVFLE